MPLLHITASYKPAYIYGGPIYSVSALCEALAKKGHQVDVFTTTANGREELEETGSRPKNIEGVSVYYFKRLTKDHTHFSPSLLKHLWKTARQYDAVHIHSWWNLPAVLSALVCILRGVRPIVSPRGMLSAYTQGKNNLFQKKILHSLLGKHLLKQVKFHATSLQEAEEVRKTAGHSAEVSIIHNLVKIPSDDLAGQNQDEGIFKLLFLSRVHQKKGIELLIDALSKTSFQFRLSVVGQGEEKYLTFLKQEITAKGIDGSIDWHPPVYGEGKFKLFASHDLFVLPSFNENFANVVIESLSVGTPVLLSDQVGTADFVQQHDLGWVCPPDADEIHAALEKAYADKTKRQRIRQEAPGIIRKEFSPEVLVQKYLEMYGEVKAGR